MKKRNERKGGNDFSFSYQSEFAFFVTNLWIMKTRARETDERWSKRMHTSPAHVLPSCYLFSLWLYFIYMVSFKLMLFLFFFHFYYPYIPSVMDLVQFLSKFFFSVFSFSISRDTCISICLGHYQTFSTKSNKITERALCRLWPLLWSRCHFRLQNDIFLSSFSWLSKNACDLIRVKESQKKNGAIQKSLFTKPDKEARLIVQLWECLLLGRLWHRWIY